mmetsp:Transcript_64903/g.181422  ORF Transcript_64903/g.181422 Transcript_64903/m.181422 type:complete len:229 (+) Transcript_64903:356-1042(+)
MPVATSLMGPSQTSTTSPSSNSATTSWPSMPRRSVSVVLCRTTYLSITKLTNASLEISSAPSCKSFGNISRNASSSKVGNFMGFSTSSSSPSPLTTEPSMAAAGATSALTWSIFNGAACTFARAIGFFTVLTLTPLSAVAKNFTKSSTSMEPSWSMSITSKKSSELWPFTRLLCRNTANTAALSSVTTEDSLRNASKRNRSNKFSARAMRALKRNVCTSILFATASLL